MHAYRLFSLAVSFLITLASTLCANEPAQQQQSKLHRERRILCNYDGTSTLFTRKGSQGPMLITVDDLKEAIREVAEEGSQVDTVLLNVIAQAMYYPTKVGTMIGTLSTAEDRETWTPADRQWHESLRHFLDNGIDPFAVMLAEAKRLKLEALLSFRMNDGHQMAILETKFWAEHPEFHLFHPDQGHTLDYGHQEVRDHMLLQIEEAVQRYDCDGIELDFNRFPIFFNEKTSGEQRVAKMNKLVGRIRKMLDVEGKKRNRHLVLGVRPPSENYTVPSTYEGSLKVGCDPVA